ncbi:MAG: hypothetical protein LBC73_00870 [Oscillospiraceae bacterium]|nr:hypothetical protein [Oscillospiraceae bacterium]
MAEETKGTARDQALIRILERLASEMQDQDLMLDELLEQQGSLSKTFEKTSLHLRSAQSDADRSYDRLFETMSRYRSDMLSLVNEQDRINKNIDELAKVVKNATYTIDVTSQRLTELEDKLTAHNKVFDAHHEHSIKQPEILRNTIESTERNFTQLHSATEKRMNELNKETVRQLDKFQHETLRRLLLLDGIVTSMQTLLTRTEPPEKKEFFVKRLFKKIRWFFRFKLHAMIELRKSKDSSKGY